MKSMFLSQIVFSFLNCVLSLKGVFAKNKRGYSWYLIIYFLFFMIWVESYFKKTFIPVSRILTMKTTFSYFPGMFEIPALAKYYLKKTKSKIVWNINFIRMCRKIIDDYCLQYLNVLFGIKLICLRSELNVATFRICMGATFFGMSRFKQFSPERRNR